MQREDLLNTLMVIRVDDSRDIEVGRASEAIESNLTKHAWNIFGTFGDGVEVAGPPFGEVLVGGCVAGNGEPRDGLKAQVGGEDDGALGGVLVDEMN